MTDYTPELLASSDFNEGAFRAAAGVASVLFSLADGTGMLDATGWLSAGVQKWTWDRVAETLLEPASADALASTCPDGVDPKAFRAGIEYELAASAESCRGIGAACTQPVSVAVMRDYMRACGMANVADGEAHYAVHVRTAVPDEVPDGLA